MDYIELTLDAADAEQAKILTAELADFPFESFEQEGARLKAYIPQRRNLFFPIKVINFILVYLHHVQRIAILPYCHLLRFFLYHFCTTNYFASGNGLLCSHRSTEIQAQFNGVSHSPIMRHQK